MSNRVSTGGLHSFVDGDMGGVGRSFRFGDVGGVLIVVVVVVDGVVDDDVDVVDVSAL